MPIDLPPSIVGKVKDNRHHRSRDRIRLELSPAQGSWLSTVISKHLDGMDIEDPAFNPAYQVYKNITDQMTKATNDKKVAAAVGSFEG